MIIIRIDGEVYDVSKYKHPGDGIRGIDLKDYNNKDCSEEFHYYHYTDEPFEILEKARKLGKYNGVIYLGTENEYNNKN
jgi:cytochrome b involved in lipid metabolism